MTKMNRYPLIIKMLFLFTVFFTPTITPLVHGEELGWIEKGYGKSVEEAVFNAKWSVIKKALEEVIGDQSRDERTLELIKKLFMKNKDGYLLSCKEIYVRKKRDKYVAKVHGTVDMAAIRIDSKKVIKRSGGSRKLPSIAILSDNKILVGPLSEKFKEYGYTYVDYDTKLRKYMIEFQKNIDVENMTSEEIESVARDVGINYIVEVPVAKYKNEEKNKVTGENRGSLTLHVQATSTKDSEVLGSVHETVTYCSFDKTKERTYAKAVNMIVNRLNSQIISSWEESKTTFTAYIKGVNEDQYYDIIDILANAIGDDDPRVERDPIAGRTLFFKWINKFTTREERKIRKRIKALGIDKVSFPHDNTIKIVGN